VGKNAGPILSLLWTKVHVVFTRYWRPLLVVNALPIVYGTFRSEDTGR